MKKLKFSFLFFCFFLSQEIVSQSFQGSIIVESAALVIKKHQENFLYIENNGIITSEFTSEDKRLILSGYGVYYSAKWNVGKQIQLEIRPGYFFQKRFLKDYKSVVI
ncbi:MAG: hypothetical protein RDU14_12760 [Melioribacteraceae bacterium]|nr:hypothetical protein [Melioribacteraceae bacterium]